VFVVIGVKYTVIWIGVAYDLLNFKIF